MSNLGKFITLEGVDGAGKTTHIEFIKKYLSDLDINYVLTREPGGTILGEKLREILLHDEMSPETETILMFAARNEHIDKKIKKAIKEKKIIICDRFIDSTYAYQVDNKKVTNKLINYLHQIILERIKPDMTFILKLNLNKSFQRLKKRKKLNRYDKLSKKFYKNAQKIFIKNAKKDSKRYKILDTSIDNKDAEREIYKMFLSLI